MTPILQGDKNKAGQARQQTGTDHMGVRYTPTLIQH